MINSAVTIEPKQTEEEPSKEACGHYLTVITLFIAMRYDKCLSALEFINVKGYASANETWLESAPLETSRYKARYTRKNGKRVERSLDGPFLTACGKETQARPSSKILLKKEHKDPALAAMIDSIYEYVSSLSEKDQAILLRHFGEHRYMLEIAREMADGNELNVKTHYRYIGRVVHAAVDYVKMLLKKRKKNYEK